MSPEYAMLGDFSEKSDVFSFGVMVIEIIIGKRNSESYESNHDGKGLLSYVSMISNFLFFNQNLMCIWFKYENIAILKFYLINCCRFGDNGMKKHC